MGSLRYSITRLAQLLIVLFGMSVVSFMLVHSIPGNAIELYLGTQVKPTPEQLTELKRVFGLEGPLYMQYLRWSDEVVHGNLGYSLRSGQPVGHLLLNRLPLSAELASLAIIFASVIGIPLGIISAAKQGSIVDQAVRVVALIGLSVPDFWMGTLAVIVLSRSTAASDFIALGHYTPFTVNPVENLFQLLVPAMVFGFGLSAVLMRFTRSSMLDALGSDYIRTARAKGVTNRNVLYHHALRNALFPIVTTIGYYAGYLLGGTVVIEQVFALPGMGRLVLQAVQQRDYPVVQGVVLVVGAAFVLVNFAVDLMYTAIDPRVRYG